MVLDFIAELDTMLLQFIQSWQGAIPLLDDFFMWIAGNSRAFMTLIFLAGLSWSFINCFRRPVMQLGIQEKGWKQAAKLILGVIILVAIPVVISDISREIIMRDRPFVALDLEPMLEQSIRPSLPSNHTTASFAIAGFYLIYLPRVYPGIVILAALVGFSRIYTGMHYPLDVLAGAALGLLPAILYLQIKGRRTKPGQYLMRL